MKFRWLIAASLLLSLYSPLFAGTIDTPVTLAVIVGVNQGFDRDQPALHYADDDAIQYEKLFRALGAETRLLVRPDDATRQLHSDAVERAAVPTELALAHALDGVEATVKRAKAAGREVVVYFVYAGHGNMEKGRGYISLEDGRMFGSDLEHRVVDRLAGAQVHLIIDACYSFYLAYGRGPGGRERAVRGFSQMGGLSSRTDIGFLLSTSAARESHEWEAFQSGIFSYEVRSGLYGAADANGDGQISYREIASFVQQANQNIPNDRFRPEVFARPPEQKASLIQLPSERGRIRVSENQPAHYLLEDGNGVRFAEFYNSRQQKVALLQPETHAALYVRNLSNDTEVRLPEQRDSVELAKLAFTSPRVFARGAAHDSFSKIFAEPFSVAAVDRYAFPEQGALYKESPLEKRQRQQRLAGGLVLGLGGATLATGIGLSVGAHLLGNFPAGISQVDADARNRTIRDYNIAAGVMYGVAGASVLAGTLLLALPPKAAKAVQAVSHLSLSLGAGGGMLSYGAGF